MYAFKAWWFDEAEVNSAYRQPLRCVPSSMY
jgi:hypothetical protein